MVKYKGSGNSLRLGIEVVPPSKVVSGPLTCHFCGDPVDRTRATIGNYDRLRGSVKGTVVQGARESNTIKDVWTINTKVIACPKCCLKVEKVSFPYDEG